MSRALLVLAFILLCHTNASAQAIAPCKLKALEIPPLRGIRFAMRRNEVIKLTPNLPPLTEKYGKEILSITFSSLQDEPIVKMFDGFYFVRPGVLAGFDGVRAVQIELLDGMVTSYSVTYDGSVKWDSLDEFLESASKSLGLVGEWEWVNTSKIGGKKLRCADFDVHADNTSILEQAMKLSFTTRFPSVILQMRKEEEERQRREQEEKRKKTFKP